VPLTRLDAPHFDYALPAALAPVHVGDWIVVPWGRGRRIGLVVGLSNRSPIDPDRIRDIEAVLTGAPRLPQAWFDLVTFAARYYHRGIGEVAIPAIPKLLRTLRSPGSSNRSRTTAFDRARKRWAAAQEPPARARAASEETGEDGSAEVHAVPAESSGQYRPLTDMVAGPAPILAPGSAAGVPGPEPGAAQRAALQAWAAVAGHAVHVLHGVTGSGKTEVYLRWFAAVLGRDAAAQVLLLVPEIALTPQLLAQLQQRFPAERIALLHSDTGDADRAAHWLAAVEGRARVVLGTRLAVLAPLPALAAIVVDEEHDASYKQQEGVRYSARDLAIAAAAQRGIPVVLGSATPSLESWHAVRRGRYRLQTLDERIGGAPLPRIECVDPSGTKLQHSLAPRVIEAMAEVLAGGRQALVFVNRRGYAPVLTCPSCGWLSRCPECSAYRVLHRVDPSDGAAHAKPGPRRYRLLCHHCASGTPVPRHCPDCGNAGLEALGRGTQRLEESLAELFPGTRIARLDRDVARRRGAAQKVLDAAHAGDVDLLVGTQMLAKGHDFRRLALVVALDVDAALYAADFRAPERLFATLMQVAGRAGRSGLSSRMLVQTRFPAHPLFAFLARHDYAGFADRQLAERRETGLPPWRYQAMLRAEAKELAQALAFLEQAREQAEAAGAGAAGVTVFDAIPMPMTRLQGRERAQLLVEAARRPPLHRFLAQWLSVLRGIPAPIAWQLDVDPLEI